MRGTQKEMSHSVKLCKYAKCCGISTRGFTERLSVSSSFQETQSSAGKWVSLFCFNENFFNLPQALNSVGKPATRLISPKKVSILTRPSNSRGIAAIWFVEISRYSRAAMSPISVGNTVSSFSERSSLFILTHLPISKGIPFTNNLFLLQSKISSTSSSPMVRGSPVSAFWERYLRACCEKDIFK